MKEFAREVVGPSTGGSSQSGMVGSKRNSSSGDGHLTFRPGSTLPFVLFCDV